MIDKNITYERDVHKSYMKIPAAERASMDEKLIIRRGYQGILPMEKCYVNGAGEYWYNISGKQALDVYCQSNSITQSFFERLILRICNQLELLEWNLIDSRCLLVDPEFIFVSHMGEEISFVLYPEGSEDIFDSLQQLAEYLLTKLNHSDRDGVHAVYRIYEIILAKRYSIKELKSAVMEVREKPPEIILAQEDEEKLEVMETKDSFQIFVEKILRFVEQMKNQLWKKENIEQIPDVVQPQENEEEEHMDLHPTICLTTSLCAPKGILLYEGREGYPDFQLNCENCVVGKNPRVKIYIDRESISQFHAKIDFLDDTYYIEDMNSTNGTYVNDKLMNYKEKQELSVGDIIRFADVKYRFL